MGHIRQLRYDSLVREMSKTVENLVDAATKKYPEKAAKIREDKRYDGMPERFNIGDKSWLNFALCIMVETADSEYAGSFGDGKLIPENKIGMKLAIVQHCLVAHVLKRARVFLMDVGLVKSIFESTLDWDEREEINPPFDYVYVEPTKPLEGFEESIVPTGFAFGRMKDLTELIHVVDSDVLNTNIIDIHSIFHGKSNWFAKFVPRDEMSKHLVEDARCQIREDGKTTGRKIHPPQWYSARLMLYLSSSNIQYDVCERNYTGGSREKKRNPQKSYYVTSFVKSRRSRIYEGEGGLGSKLDKRVHVRGHFFRRWYCSTCDTTSAVKEFIKKEPCRDCGDPLSLETSKVKRYWKPPHWKGPDTAEKAHRAYYRVKEGIKD